MELHVIIPFILSIIFISCVLSLDIVIQTKNGNLRGTTLTSPRGNKTFLAFMGIPYARPPVGNLRFKDPLPAENWTDVWDATKEGSVCPQLDSVSRKYKGDEDCLFLNVFTHNIVTSLPKPVMVWIHGGAFLTESGNMEYAGPHYLVEEDIIFVSINYRLGPLGFFCLGNEEVPGNAGLKDQVLALKWVQENIKDFGGDPNKVTIAGESAGAASVEFHKLSPMSKGLFHGAISESGTSLYMGDNLKHNASIPFKFAEILYITTRNKSELLQKLRTLPAEQLIEAVPRAAPTLGFGLIFIPTVDKDFAHEDVFLPDAPINLLNSGKFYQVPSIIGINSAEGILFFFIVRYFTIKIEKFIEWDLGTRNYLQDDVETSTYKEIIGKIKNFYFSNTTNNLNIQQDFVNYITDTAFNLGTYCTAKLVAAHSSAPTYLYEFDFVGEMNLFKKIFGGWNLTGASHVDEQLYIYSRLPDKFKDGSRELEMSRKMVRMWVNFVKIGNPTPKTDPLLENLIWSPINKMAEGYLYINEDLKFILGHIKDSNIDFWTQLHQNYSKHSLCSDENTDGGGASTLSAPTSLIILIFLLYFLPSCWILKSTNGPMNVGMRTSTDYL